MDGGYDQWLLYYPQLTTNSNITRPKTDVLSSIPSCMYRFLYLNLCSRLCIFFYMASKALIVLSDSTNIIVTDFRYRGRDRMAVGFTNIYAISAYHY